MAIVRDAGGAGVSPLDKIPPHDAVAEQSLLGSIMLSKEAISEVVEQVAAEDFYLESHRSVFSAICSLYADNRPVDTVTVSDELDTMSELGKVGGAEYIQLLINTVPTAANASYYAGIVKRHALLRNLLTAATKIARLAYGAPDDAVKTADEAEQLLYSAIGKRTTERIVHIKELVSESLDALSRDTADQNLLTGYTELDKLTSGFGPSDLVVVAARPSMGKTSLALCIAGNVAIEQGKTVAVFSLEMNRHQLTQRLLCSEARVNAQAIRREEISGSAASQLSAAAGRVSQAPIYIDDTPSITLMELRSKARRLAAKETVDLVIVDYLQLMSSGLRVENRQQEIAEISRSLKVLGRELEAPVIAVSQLSRAAEQSSGERPRLSHLRESGAIEQDADMVIFIYREKYYNPDEEENIAEIIVAKNRNGPIGLVHLTFLEDYAKFENCTHRYDDDY